MPPPSMNAINVCKLILPLRKSLSILFTSKERKKVVEINIYSTCVTGSVKYKPKMGVIQRLRWRTQVKFLLRVICNLPLP